jgi:hypothetical protein
MFVLLESGEDWTQKYNKIFTKRNAILISFMFCFAEIISMGSFHNKGIGLGLVQYL